MGDEIHKSFLHPKKFQIGELELKTESGSKSKTEKRKNEPTNFVSKKHKFQLV